MASLQTKGEKGFRIFSIVVMALITIAAFLPFILIIMASFTEENTLIKYGYTFFPKKLSLASYSYLFAHASTIVRSYCVSIGVTVLGTAISLLLTTMLAYPMSRKDFKYRNVLAFIVFFTMLFSGGIVPSYIMWAKLIHVTNTYAALIFPTYLIGAFNVLLVRNYFTNNVPPALIESAQIDGAKEITIFFKIMLPLSVPVLITIGLFTGLGYWNDWINALYYITNPKFYGIQNLLIYIMNNIQYISSGDGARLLGNNAVQIPTTGIRMAMAVVGILPIVIVFPFFQKYLTEGIVIGAIKG